MSQNLIRGIEDCIIELFDKLSYQYSYSDELSNTVGLYMKLNIHTDMDIIRWLQSQRSKQGSIKKLIREEIARKESESSPS